MTGSHSFIWLTSTPLCIRITFSLSIHLLIASKSFFVFFLRQSLTLLPGWSAVARSWLTATSTFWVQMIPLPQPPKVLRWQAWGTVPGLRFFSVSTGYAKHFTSVIPRVLQGSPMWETCFCFCLFLFWFWDGVSESCSVTQAGDAISAHCNLCLPGSSDSPT